VKGFSKLVRLSVVLAPREELLDERVPERFFPADANMLWNRN
jgi:hypothetical protein